MLLANPKRFCSRNPLARPVDNLNRFGLAGPVAIADRDQLSADLAAQMLPVVLVLEHSAAGGTTGVLLERRTGALMGDVSMEDFGCVAISPLWLGGIERQETLKIVHTCGDEVASAAPLKESGLALGGWEEARPKVADSSLAESRFKFFIGSTVWGSGQLEREMQSEAWFVLDVPPEVILKDRVMDMMPGQIRPLWTELAQLLGDDFAPYLSQVYAD